MKLLLLSVIILASACGKYDVVNVGTSRVGEPLSIDTLSPADRTNLNAVCFALATKNATAGSTLNFKAFEADCTGNTVADADVQVAIQQNGSSFSLVRKVDGRAFIFPDIETDTSGLLADICGNISNVQNPLDSGSSRMTVTTTGIDPADCRPASEEICVKVFKASLSNGTYVVHTKDWMRVKVSDNVGTGKLGYFTSRKKVTKSYCGQNEAVTFKADLK